MKNTYVKPGFSFAPIALAANISASCAEDVATLEEIWGEGFFDNPNLFGTAEVECTDKFQQYCKFTSANISGNKPIFGS